MCRIHIHINKQVAIDLGLLKGDTFLGEVNPVNQRVNGSISAQHH